MKAGKLFLYFLIVLVWGCSTSCSVQRSPSTPTPSAAPSLSPVPTLSPSPTGTIQPTVTHTMPPSATAKPMPQCVDVILQKYPFPSTNFSGSLALVSSNYQSQGSYLLDLAEDRRTSLPNSGFEGINDAVPSPDGRWLAYQVMNESTKNGLLMLVDSSGEEAKQINLDELFPAENVILVDWLDNQRILLVKVGKTGLLDNKTVILNPSTGEWSQDQSSYEDIYSLYPQYFYLWGRNFRTLRIFHPTLKWVIYKSFDGVVLRDLTRKENIKEFQDNVAPHSSGPVWSPDGESFIIDLDSPTGRNLYLVSTTGEAKQITSFEGRPSGALMDFTWSPDGQSIAFWLATQRGVNYALTILDVNTLEMKSLCIQPFSYKQTDPSGYIYWSPDGESLVVAAQNQEDRERSKAILVDPLNNLAYDVADEVIPAGWMVHP